MFEVSLKAELLLAEKALQSSDELATKDAADLKRLKLWETPGCPFANLREKEPVRFGGQVHGHPFTPSRFSAREERKPSDRTWKTNRVDVAGQ
jgi:hypothetical protein